MMAQAQVSDSSVLSSKQQAQGLLRLNRFPYKATQRARLHNRQCHDWLGSTLLQHSADRRSESQLASRVAWKMPGVVRLEKVMVLAVDWSRLKPPRN